MLDRRPAQRAEQWWQLPLALGASVLGMGWCAAAAVAQTVRHGRKRARR